MRSITVCLVIAVLSLIASLVTLSSLPEGMQLPIHWNVSGQVDRWADAQVALFIPPAIMIFIVGLLAVLRFIEPRKDNIKQSGKSVGAMSLVVVMIMAVMEVGYIAIAHGIEFSMHLLVVFSIGLGLMVIGNYFGKTRSNFFFGIRTPWTLSSDSVWQKTHRLAGKLFMVAGAIVAVSCWLVSDDRLSWLILAVVLPAALTPVAYSWWVWKQEQLS